MSVLVWIEQQMPVQEKLEHDWDDEAEGREKRC